VLVQNLIRELQNYPMDVKVVGYRLPSDWVFSEETECSVQVDSVQLGYVATIEPIVYLDQPAVKIC
jgi:hypothetical protein